MLAKIIDYRVKDNSMKVFKGILRLFNFITNFCKFSSHFVNVGVRYYLFTIFFYSGLVKTKAWESTLFLFQYEYKVTWLPVPESIVTKYNLTIPPMDHILAAYMGTGAEIILPCLLLIGFGGRLPALMLFVFNYVAFVSYPFLWTDAGIAGFKDHLLWGALIGYTLFFGPGKISLDQIIRLKFSSYKY